MIVGADKTTETWWRPTVSNAFLPHSTKYEFGQFKMVLPKFFLFRSIELLENHFERGSGVLNAVQARLARRQLPRITPDGLVEYSLQGPIL